MCKSEWERSVCEWVCAILLLEVDRRLSRQQQRLFLIILSWEKSRSEKTDWLRSCWGIRLKPPKDLQLRRVVSRRPIILTLPSIPFSHSVAFQNNTLDFTTKGGVFTHLLRRDGGGYNPLNCISTHPPPLEKKSMGGTTEMKPTARRIMSCCRLLLTCGDNDNQEGLIALRMTS